MKTFTIIKKSKCINSSIICKNHYKILQIIQEVIDKEIKNCIDKNNHTCCINNCILNILKPYNPRCLVSGFDTDIFLQFINSIVYKYPCNKKLDDLIIFSALTLLSRYFKTMHHVPFFDRLALNFVRKSMDFLEVIDAKYCVEL